MSKIWRRSVLDVLVVGDGVNGLSLIYSASNIPGKKVVCVTKGIADVSSMYGERICALSRYRSSADLQTLDQSIEQWKKLEKKWQLLQGHSKRLFVNDQGVLLGGEPDSVLVEQCQRCLNEHPHRLIPLKPSGIKHFFPQFVIPSDYRIFWDKRGGFLTSENCIEALKLISKNQGARLYEGHEMVSYDSVSHVRHYVTGANLKISVRELNGAFQNFYTKKMVMALGPFTQSVAKKAQVDVRVHLQEPADMYVCGDLSSFSEIKLPAYVLHAQVNGVKCGVYGFSLRSDETVMRIGAYGRNYTSTNQLCLLSEKTIEDISLKEQYESYYRSFFKQFFSTLHVEDVGTYFCPVTHPVNHDNQVYGLPVIDYHPDSVHCMMVVGPSGKGFKGAIQISEDVMNSLFDSEKSDMVELCSLKRYLEWKEMF